MALVACVPAVPMHDDSMHKTDHSMHDEEPAMDASVEESFMNSSHRVLHVAKNPFRPEYISVVTERSDWACGTPEQPALCANETGCGGAYTMPVCSFFSEPDFNVESKPHHFIGSFNSEKGASIILDSITFTSENTLEFDAAFGDAGAGVSERYALNLDTGQLGVLRSDQVNIGQ